MVQTMTKSELVNLLEMCQEKSHALAWGYELALKYKN